MIHFIFAEEQRPEMDEILRFLEREKHLSDTKPDQDCAVILVSNEAVRDEKWKKLVDELPEDVRLIPVNCAINTDNLDIDQVPAKIREINFIFLDGNHFEKIWDAIITEKDFYSVKSMLMLNRSAWIFSDCSEDFLLTNLKKIKQHLRLFQSKWAQESDEFFREQLGEIIEYLQISRTYARRLLARRIFNYVKRIAAAVIAIGCLILFVKLVGLTNRMRTTNILVGTGTYEEVAPVNAVKLVDGITNPLIASSAKTEMYIMLSEHLNRNWHNTPVGVGYKWAGNDGQFAADERYIWTANGDGSVIKWDTYTGQITEKKQVSSQPLTTIAVSEAEELLVTVDRDGYLYKRMDGGKWEQCPDRYDVAFDYGTNLVCCGQTGQAALLDASGTVLWFDLKSGFDPVWEGRADEIFCGELTAAGLEAVVRRDGGLYDLFVDTDGTAEETPIPVEYDTACTMDIRNGVVLLSDTNFQLVTWSRSEPEAVRPAGIVLSKPIALCFLSDDVIVWHDRNAGTHLYDLTRRLDLGSLLKVAKGVSYVAASGSTVMAAAPQAGVFYTENVEALLPLDQLEGEDVLAVYTETEAASDGFVQRVSVESDYLILMEFEDADLPTIIDSASRLETGPAQRDVSLLREEELTFSSYASKPVDFVGKPTVVGITGSGDVLLAGGSDGAFYEVVFIRDGRYMLGSQLQIPSHAAIAAIYETADCYYLEDATGTFWRARTGYGTLTAEGAIAAVKEKLHCAATEDIHDTISKETIEALDVAVMPGGGTKEWE